MDKEQVKQIVLQGIGLSDHELRNYLRKVDEFYRSLTDAERRVFDAGFSAVEEDAYSSFDGDITAEELEDFITSREPEGAVFTPVWGLIDGGDDEDDEDDDDKKQQ